MSKIILFWLSHQVVTIVMSLAFGMWDNEHVEIVWVYVLVWPVLITMITRKLRAI